jgi:hypothetical protein
VVIYEFGLVEKWLLVMLQHFLVVMEFSTILHSILDLRKYVIDRIFDEIHFLRMQCVALAVVLNMRFAEQMLVL